jgi:nucleotide-binding universal stress UspA family protein
MPTGSTSLVVVGVDASRQSLIALRWAAEYARATGARLRAVAAWRYPTTYGITPDWSKMDFEAWATQQLETSVAATLGDSPDIPVETSAVEGQPAPVLLEAASDADLLVVGSHGHGRFTGMLMGSVSTHCVEHANCPVVVVRGETRVAAAGDR